MNAMDLENGKDMSRPITDRLFHLDTKPFKITACRIELYGQDIEEIDQETDKTKDEIESAMESGESKWQFEICDTLTNTGPIVSMDIGQRASNDAV